MSPDDTVKYVDTREYVKVLEALLKDHRTVRLPVSGNSMSPFLITARDSVLVREPEQPLKEGDVVLFQRDSGEYILHRICRIKNGEYYIVGDAQTRIEGPIRREQIFGLVIRAQRKGIWIDERDRWWKFFQYVWIRLIPFRPFLRKLYGIIAGPHSHRKTDE